MPINVVAMPVHPACDGDQWTINNINNLAELVAHVLVGRAFHAASILQGIVLQVGPITPELKNKLDVELHPDNEQRIYHRDGILFEIICWIAARMTTGPSEALTDPHLKATNQGADCLKIKIDLATGQLESATIYEQKCTTNGRAVFNGSVLNAFTAYATGERDNELAQGAIALLEKLGIAGGGLKPHMIV